MRRVAVASLLLMIAGCGRPGAPAPAPQPATAGKSVVGRWVVTSIDGKPIPAGTTITVDYKPDGKLVVERSGTDATAVALDEAKLKTAMDAASLFPDMVLDNLTLSAEGFRIEMRRKPGTTVTPP
jgi:hypothetical protein